MSHAVYSFLISISEQRKPETTKELVAKEFDTGFGGRLDENNWYTHMGIVTRSGDALPMIDGDDWRNREWLQERITGLQPEQRWQWAWDFSARLVAVDLKLFDTNPYSFGEQDEGSKRIEAMTCKEIQAAILAETPPRITQLYAAFNDPLPRSANEEWIRNYSRWSLVVNFEAAVRCDHFPFTERDLDAYQHRVFDLTNGDEGNVILFTDIHT